MAATNASYTSHYVDVYGSKMHYIEQGAGTPILFLHGMPTSSYLWRNIIPFLAPLGRCIAPDFIGMGKSDKPDIEYSIRDHIKYIEKFIETLNLKRLTIVMHDLGSVVGFDYAMRHESNCKGLVFYEAYLRPMNGDDVSLPLFEQINSLQEQENAADLILNGAMFVDKVLPQGMMRPLTEEEMANYREPFLAEGAGKPLHTYLKEMPRLNSKTEMDKVIAEYSQKLISSKLPKLMLFTVPGFVTTMATASWAKENIPNLEIVDIGEELHYAQESNPGLMGETISVWLQGVEQA
ncbi:MAG: haloalkane dehalogenase [Gammaproteobacteria bacterium]|nr:haloalkane dehalogenase [Gammaproteobacteria bacterium]